MSRQELGTQPQCLEFVPLANQSAHAAVAVIPAVVFVRIEPGTWPLVLESLPAVRTLDVVSAVHIIRDLGQPIY